MLRRAIGLTRVSAEGDRETVHSYQTQAARIQRDCETAGYQLLYVGQERNVSGGSNLTNRPELSRAVAAVESGEADVIVAAYFDRFFRSLDVQGEVIKRIEAAGGEVLTLDHGMLTNATPARRLQANIVGAMAQFFREQTGEKTKAGQSVAVAAGKLPYPKVPLGYLKGADGVLVPDRATRSVVAELFERRAAEESIHALSRWLTSKGYCKSTTGVRTILKSRVYLGEIHFGDLMNRTAHEPIIDPELWSRAQRGTGESGRPALGEPRLLARLGVLRCQCGTLMALGSQVQTLPLAGRTRYHFYRCGANPPCGGRQVIQAHIAEDFVSNAVIAAMRDAQGRASMAESAQDAQRGLETAQTALESALRVFELTGAENESAAVERIAALVQKRDDARATLDQIGPEPGDESVDMSQWDTFPLDLKRNLIRRAVESATVAPGRGADRITVQLRHPSR